MNNPLRLKLSGQEVEIRPPGLIQSVSYRQIFSSAPQEDRPLIAVGVLARTWPEGAAPPWGVIRERSGETLAELGGRVLEAAYAARIHPDEVCGAGIQVMILIGERVRPPSAEAVQAAEVFSPGPTGSGSSPGSSSPSDGSTPPSDGSN